MAAFTEQGDAPGAARGGRHVEWGAALLHSLQHGGRWPELTVVGPVESIFYAAPDIRRFPDANALVAFLQDKEA